MLKQESKAATRIVYDNARPDGSLQCDRAAIAIMQYRNTPLQDINLSPAQILFHRQLRDPIPTHPSHYQLHEEWLAAAKTREEEYHKKHVIIALERDRHAKTLSPLKVGTFVSIQGKDKHWKKHGYIVECLDHEQYRIRCCGSGRITLRNRRFLRECASVNPPNNRSLPYSSPIDSDSESPGGQGGNDPVDANSATTPVDTDSASTSVESDSPVTPASANKSTLPLALRKLMPYNKPGLKELLPSQ